MKIIGRTEAGARLVEITTEEMIALTAASHALNTISLLDCVIVNQIMPPVIPLPPPPGQSENRPPIICHLKERKTQSRKNKLPTDRVNHHKTCEICGKAFVDKSRTNSRKICAKASCKHEQKKRTCNCAYYKSRGPESDQRGKTETESESGGYFKDDQ
jgi:hypothetical protein